MNAETLNIDLEFPDNGSRTFCNINCESISEVIMRTWVKNSVRITAHCPRFPIVRLSKLDYTVPKNDKCIMDKK